MGHSAGIASPSFARHRSTLAIALIVLAMLGAAANLNAQTFTVLHTFTGGSDGASPHAGLMLDAAGNLYGSATQGALGYGSVFKLTNQSRGRAFAPLYGFHGSDGADPESPLILGRDGALYGTTRKGGQQQAGTIFRLTPPPMLCSPSPCPWTETVLYQFTGGVDGMQPQGNLTFDQAGNLYGTSSGMPVNDGLPSDGPPGSVWQLASAGGSWNFRLVHAFSNSGGDGTNPNGGLVVDSGGNVYGTTAFGGVFGNGTVFEMMPTPSGWSERILYNFFSVDRGALPQSGLIADSSGNMFGVTFIASAAFEMTQSGGGWNYSTIANVSTANGPFAALTFDAQGRLYGATYNGGRFGWGNVFRVSRTNGLWSCDDLYDFTGGNDGGWPLGSLVVDTAGNIYGTTSWGGSQGYGTMWMLTQ